VEPLHIVWLAVVGIGAVILIVNAIRMGLRWNNVWFTLPAILGVLSVITIVLKLVTNTDPESLSSSSVFLFLVGFIILVLLKSQAQKQNPA
jgi:hypothetical protein